MWRKPNLESANSKNIYTVYSFNAGPAHVAGAPVLHIVVVYHLVFPASLTKRPLGPRERCLS